MVARQHPACPLGCRARARRAGHCASRRAHRGAAGPHPRGHPQRRAGRHRGRHARRQAARCAGAGSRLHAGPAASRVSMPPSGMHVAPHRRLLLDACVCVPAPPMPHPADLVFLQNGMLQPWLDAKGLGDNTQVCVCVCGGGGASGCWLAGRPLQTAAARAGAGAGTHSGPAALRIMRVPHRCWCTLLWPSWGMRPWTARQTSTQRGSQQVCRGAALVVGLLQHAAKHCRATRTCAPARCRC
jgi:hypothetical protein